MFSDYLTACLQPIKERTFWHLLVTHSLPQPSQTLQSTHLGNESSSAHIVGLQTGGSKKTDEFESRYYIRTNWKFAM